MLPLAEAEVRVEIGKREYETRLESLRIDLLRLQFELRERDFGALVIVAGDDRLGTQELLDGLHEWLDTRLLTTAVFTEPRPEEAERPFFWRYWRALPRRGQLGIFYRGWVTQMLLEHLRGKLDADGLTRRIEHAREFERDWLAAGGLLIKLWLHLPRKEHERRLRAADGDWLQAWRIREQDREIYRHYRRGMRELSRLLSETSPARASWHVVDSMDSRHRDLQAASLLRDALEARIGGSSQEPRGPARSAPVDAPTTPARTPLAEVDLSASLARKDYRAQLARSRARVGRLARRAFDAGVASVLVFEGWDAAGKGGAIRRLTRALDAGTYRVLQTAAPTPEERSYPYLWRFWRDIPRDGHVAIFDRSWYGRVLVERVEGFASDAEWQRAYAEIACFEDQLALHGIYVAKFWLEIDPDTQLERFRERERTPFKMYKISDEDYRNRARWEDYARAANEMILRTDSARAPWHVIAANHKRHARVAVLEHVRKGLARVLDGKPPGHRQSRRD